jgi:pyruvate dehydrogenase E2 component (dihydrolipoamide acetyltransferase)
MPETGSDDGALLISWFKAPGALVEADEPICMVRVGDLTAEIVSPSAGVVGGIYAETGQQIPPGASLAEILPAQAGAEPAAIEPEPEPVAEPDPEPEPEPEGDPEPDLPVFAEPALRADPEPAAATVPEPERELIDPLASLASEIEALEIAFPDLELAIPSAPAPEPEPEPELVAKPEPERKPEPDPEPELEPPPPVDLATFRSPAVRRLAEQHGLDLDRIAGSGRDGRVTRDDILASL